MAALDPEPSPKFKYSKIGSKGPGEMSTQVLVLQEDIFQSALKISQSTTISVTTVAEQTEWQTDQSRPLHDPYADAMLIKHEERRHHARERPAAGAAEADTCTGLRL